MGTGPAADATLDSAPSSVTLEFSDAPQALGSQVAVTGPDGAPVSAGAPEITGETVRQQLDQGLPAGGYTVDWRVTSADGHPLSGTFGFRVIHGAAPGGGSEAGQAAPRGGGASATASDDSPSPTIWMAIGAIVAVAAFLVVRQLRRPV